MFGMTIPLPLAAALLAGIVAVRVILVNKSFNWPNVLIALFFVLLGTQTILTSIRFSPALQTTVHIQPVLAMLICPIAFVAFRALAGAGRDGISKLNLCHAIPAVFMAVILTFDLTLPIPIDGLIWMSFLLYIVLLVQEISKGPDSFERFGTEAINVLVTARIVTVCLLAVILAYDIVFFINLEFWGGSYTNEIVLVGSLLLIFISLAVLLFPNSFPIDIGMNTSHSASSFGLSSEASTQEDNKTYHDLEQLMHDKQPYLDPNINLTKLARQLKTPARSISNSVNRVGGQNFSQFINRYRVTRACSLLTDTNMPITEIMFEAGFQTKSTFNREFLTITGKSPSDYRKLAGV